MFVRSAVLNVNPLSVTVQFARHSEWEAAGNLALVGMGVEPGMSNVFAKYAAEHLNLAEIDEIGVRDGSNIGA